MKIKSIQTLFFFLIIIQVSFCQDLECDLLNKGLKYYEEEKLDSAIVVWESVVKNYPDTSNCYGRSFNNIPIVYAQLERKKLAKEWFQKIIDSKLNDLDEGSGIMTPYANYKHNACLRMALLLKDENLLEESLKYINLAETKFPYQTFSATSFEKRTVSITFDKAELYKLKDNHKMALLIMLEKILDDDIFFRIPDASSITYVDFYAGLIEDIKPMIQESYGYIEFEKRLKASINQLEIKNVTIGKENKAAKVATFTFEGKLFTIGASNESYDRQKFIDKLINNRIFKELKKD